MLNADSLVTLRELNDIGFRNILIFIIGGVERGRGNEKQNKALPFFSLFSIFALYISTL